MVVLRLPARHGGLRKSLENESDFIEIHAVGGKYLEINKTNSVLRVLYGVMSLCSLCNYWGFLHHWGALPPGSIPQLSLFPALRGGQSRSPSPFRGVGLGTTFPPSLRS